MPLKKFAGVVPLYGIKTGLNEAFLIDTPTKEKLTSAHPSSAALIKPYLRGQDIKRWEADWDRLWMIFSRKGTQIENYPAIKAHLEKYQGQLEPKPTDYVGDNWGGRKAGSYQWYELQDPVDYWEAFEQPKFCIQRIAYHPRTAYDATGYYLNDSAIILPTTDMWLLAALNSPAVWYYLFRTLPHKKDEALAMDIPYVREIPIPNPTKAQRSEAEAAVTRLIELAGQRQAGRTAILDWLKVEFAVEKPSLKLQDPAGLTADAFFDEVKKGRKRKAFSVAEVKRLKDEHAASVVPLQKLAREADGLERRVSDIVNEAFGLTPADVKLMWETAPPRMPIAPPG